MIFFSLSADIQLERQNMTQRLAGAHAHGPDYVTSMYDFFEIQRSMGAGPGERRMAIVPEDTWFEGRESPAGLGLSNRGEYARFLARAGGAPPQEAPAPARLDDQLQDLASRDSLRISVINGFGTGIGDTLVGLTAWRKVRQVMAGFGLDDVDADLWVRPRAFANARDVCDAGDAIDRVGLLPMPVDQFEQRDAFFDLSGLADRPGIDAQPMIDFFLDQMGVESAAVPAADKRNSIRLPGGVLDEVRKTTRALGSRYVVLHPLSSNFIRNMPADVFRALAARLVEATGCDVATLIPTPRVHPRMVDLSAVSRRGYPFFCALIAEAAGLVSVDTSTYHVADAFDTPSVVLFSTIPPRLRVAYYPTVEGVLLPGMEDSPLLGRHRVDDRGEAGELLGHWSRLDVPDVVDRLVARMPAGD
jgi:hypothetical protein